MQLILVRHGRPEHGAADPPLDPTGARQAEAVARVLSDGQYGRAATLLSSPMRRAQETAAPTSKATGIQPVLDPRLVEFDHGIAAYGDGFAEFSSRREAWDSINAGRWLDHRFDPEAFASRVVDGIEQAIDRVLSRSDGAEGHLIAFCHAGVISAYVGHVVRAARPLFMAVDYGSISRFHVDSDGYREVLSVNERGHLQADRPAPAHTERSAVGA